MVPVIPNPKAIRSFPSQAAFERWLRAHHATDTELWLKIHKKDSGLKTVTYAEALDVALCWGWIDGLKKSFDDRSFLQRFSPRKARSIWSEINTRHVARLIQEGRMQSSGQVHIDAAKADGRWAAAYSAQRDMQIPDDLALAIKANRKASNRLATLNKRQLFLLAFRVQSARRPETRHKRIADFVKLLASGDAF